MSPQRRRLSFFLGLGWSAASAMLSGCYVNVVPLSGMGPDPDGGTTVDARPPEMTPPDASAPDARPPEMTPPDAGPAVDGSTPNPSGAGGVDLLVVVDDSNSMTVGQDFLAGSLGSSILGLFASRRVTDVHVGVVSTDLGTPGATVPGCVGPEGDNGALNPRRRGDATRTRTLPNLDDNAFCDPMLDAAPFMTLRPGDDAMHTYWAPSCHARVGVGGCGLEQQLESAYRALVMPGGAAMLNAGFLRPEATLAILVLSDEDDGSVRDCRHHDGVGACDDAVDVFDVASTRWASPDLNMRLYDYDPGGPQDPTWSLDRYVDPARPTRGFLGLKPGHPERVVFGAITGVPRAVPQRPDGSTDWDSLLGPASFRGPDDFVTRESGMAYAAPMAPGGPVSMRQRDPDPVCPGRMVPACRAIDRGSATSCLPSEQPFAWRARRIAEIARRLDESALCGGAPCHNGMVSSICDTSSTAPLERFMGMIARRLAP